MGASGNFSNIDEEERRRFWEITADIGRQHLEAKQERAAAEAEKQGESAPERSDDDQAGDLY
jgi:hypothetical protein